MEKKEFGMIVKLRIISKNFGGLKSYAIITRQSKFFDVIIVSSHRKDFYKVKAPKLVNESEFKMKQKNRIYLTFSFARIKLVMGADY